MKITKEKLKKMYETMPNKEICRVLKITNPTLIKHLIALDIPLKGKGGKNKLIIKK